jgi:predicted O-linked N-acetylglucosamine transferase (SPINDLY family)
LSTFDQALHLHQQGNASAAEALYRQVLAKEPNHAPALHMLGVASFQRGDFQSAIEHIARAIAIEPDSAVFFNNYGAALLALQRPAEALACFHRSLALHPDYADAASNVAMAYEALGQVEKAASYYRTALKLQPEHKDADAKYTALVNRLGDTAEALRLCQEKLHREPTATLHVRMASLLINSGQSSEALPHLQQALSLDPRSSDAQFALASVHQDQQEVAKARDLFLDAARCNPLKPLWKLRAYSICPPVFQTAQEIDDYCNSLAEQLDCFIQSPPPARWSNLLNAGAFPTFSLSYLGRNVRPLKEEFSRLYSRYFDSAVLPEGSGLSSRHRIGFLVSHRHEGIFLRCMQGILESLDQERFEVVLICSAASERILKHAIKSPGIRIAPFTNRLHEAAHTIRDLRCDVLHFWEAGSDVFNYFLPFCRLAPVQSTSHGSQITSGNPAIDYFYSSKLMETESAADYYTEKLWLSETLLMNQPRLPVPPPTPRSKFGLPEDRTLYMALQNPMKFHPDFDPLLGEVLRRDLRGIAVLLRGNFEIVEMQLRQRFARTMPDVQDRIIFVPQQPFLEYCQLTSMADVVLDPLHFGHGSSGYDVFSFNRPLVTLPTALNVGRVTTAFYTKMGWTDLVASSAEEYVDLAVRLGTNLDFRQAAIRQISERSDALFNDRQATLDHERFFAEIAQKA